MEYSCSYVVARLVNDPLRAEARNFGIILQCLELGYIDGKFETNLRERLAGVAALGDVEVVEAYVSEWRSMMAGFRGTSIGLPLPGPHETGFLRKLWEGHTQRIQFTEPRGCISSQPSEMLDELFGQLVAEPSAPVAMADHVTFRQEFVSALRNKQLIGPRKVRPHYEIMIGRKTLPVDFGYRTPRYEVLMETVDLTAASLLDRINSFSPTAIKFEMAKEAKGRSVKTYSAVKTASNGHSVSVHRFELEALSNHTDEIFLMSKRHDTDRLWEVIGRDLGIAQPVALFSPRRVMGGAKKR